MNELAIRARGLAKQYPVGQISPYRTLRESLMRLFQLRKGRTAAPGQIWVLDDVSFDIRHGEAVGIIGRNGAGKSTLLKVLARITAPTRGVADLYGRVGSLLEVGSGFHHELTGRENVYLNGAILGMRRVEVARKLEEIVSFAEVEAFVDTPVKYYSSGMYMRLAFSVAAHLEPEILLVDEALAVGDASFQKKALGKMEDAARSGRTVLFVSHNMEAVLALTRRGLVMNAGKIIYDGPSEEAVRQYRRSFGDSMLPSYINPDVHVGVRKARVITSDPAGMHRLGEPLRFEFDLSLGRRVSSLDFIFQLIDDQYRSVINLRYVDREQRHRLADTVRLRCTLPKPRLYFGRYSLRTHLGDRTTLAHLETVESICEFEIGMDTHPDEAAWLPEACVYLEDGVWESNFNAGNQAEVETKEA